MEVLALLVQATVFKIAGSHGNHVIGGFDSHALPPSWIVWLTLQQRADMHSLVSIQIGKPREMKADPSHALSSKLWRSAIFKTPVLGPVAVGLEGIHGDGQADLENHGGIDKAICVYPTEHLCFWREQLDRTDFEAGAFGENFSVAGLEESSVAIGDQWQIGNAIFEVSQPRQPCWKLARRWQTKSLTTETIETGKTGWYLRVIQTGMVESGASIGVTPITSSDQARFSIADANRLFYQKQPDIDGIRKLLEVTQLSESWRSDLQERLHSAR